MINWILTHWWLFAGLAIAVGAFLFRCWIGEPTPDQLANQRYWATKPWDDSPGFW